MKMFVLLAAVILAVDGQAPIGLLFSSNWSGSPTDITPVISFLFGTFNCKPPASAQLTFNLYFVTPGLSFLSPLSAMTTENTRLNAGNIKYAIGETNNFLNYVFPQTTSFTQVTPMYPSDAIITRVVIFAMNYLYDPNQNVKQGIMVILKRSNDINNLNINNYKNYINIINQQNWTNVVFQDYISAENIIYQLRLKPYYNIISFLSDPSDNRDLIQKAFKANLMVWRYRWIVVNLLGEVNVLSDKTLFRSGVTTNNVTIITFADIVTGKTGRNALLEDALRLVRYDGCEFNQGIAYEGITGTVNSFSGVLSRQTYKFGVYVNPGSNLSLVTYIVLDTSNSLAFTTPVTFVPFVMNLNASTTATRVSVFRIGYVNFPPFSYMDGGNYTGFVMEMLIQMLVQTNVSYTIVDLSGQYNGLSQGTLNSSTLIYSQLLGLVQNNVVDTLSFLLINNIQLQSYFDLSSSVLPGSMSVLYKNRTYTGINALITYTFPFDWAVWVTFFGSALGVAIALAISDYVFPDKYARYRFLMSLFFAFSSLTHGAYFDPPRRLGGRIIMSFWWLFCLVVVIIWACNYAAFLALTKYSSQLINVFSLLNQKVLTYGTLNDGLLISYLSTNNQSDPQSMLQILTEDVSNGSVASLEAAVSFVNNQPYAFIYSDRIITYLRNTNCLDMFGNWMGFEYCLVLPKDSEKTLAFNYAITQNRANGVIDNLATKYWPVYNNTCLSTSILDTMNTALQQLVPNTFTGSLDIRLMIGIFVILIGGSVCCLVLAIIERFIRWLIQIKKDRRDKYEYDNTVEQLTKF